KEPADLGGYEDEAKGPEKLPLESGLHRVVWDLRYEGAKTIKGARLDGGKPKNGPLVLPGSYTLELTVEGKKLTQKVEVVHDPRLVLSADTGGMAELTRRLEAQRALLLKIRDDITRLTKVVEQLRSVRKQLQARDELLKDDPKAKELHKDT